MYSRLPVTILVHFIPGFPTESQTSGVQHDPAIKPHLGTLSILQESRSTVVQEDQHSWSTAELGHPVLRFSMNLIPLRVIIFQQNPRSHVIQLSSLPTWAHAHTGFSEYPGPLWSNMINTHDQQSMPTWASCTPWILDPPSSRQYTRFSKPQRSHMIQWSNQPTWAHTENPGPLYSTWSTAQLGLRILCESYIFQSTYKNLCGILYLINRST